MISAFVSILCHFILHTVSSHIHFASENGFERFLSLFGPFSVDPIAIVKKLFYTKHVAMVCDGHASHAIAYCLVHEFLYARLSIEY